MALPELFYLRHVSGEAIGPVSLLALEVLFDHRVIDHRTPVSKDGLSYLTLKEWRELHAHIEAIKTSLGEGQNPWKDRPTKAEPPKAIEYGQNTAIAHMVRAIADRMSGHLTLHRSDERIRLTYKDGKIVVVDTNIEELALAQYLVNNGVVRAAEVDRAKEMAPQMGGDLGGALIAQGVVQPHVYFEKLIAWAKQVLGATVEQPFERVHREDADVPAPPVPLGFDLWSIPMEAVRVGCTQGKLSSRLDDKRPCPVIPSQVEGVSVEDLKLQPKELRVLRAVDGVKSLGELVDEMGGRGEEKLPVLRAIYFAEQAGFIVFGEDPTHRKELAEAQTLEAEYRRLIKLNYFEVLDVTEKNSDDEVRAKYAELAKRYHPDKVRPGAASALIEARRKIFSLISEVTEALESSEQRYQYAQDVEQGVAGNKEQMQKVRDVLESETLYKKVEILLRVRKFEEAQINITQALQLNPDDPEFKIAAAFIDYQVAKRQGDGDDALDTAIRAIKLLVKANPDIASGYLRLAQLYVAQGREDLALKNYDKVLHYDEHHQEALSYVRVARMRKDKAKKKKKWL